MKPKALRVPALVVAVAGGAWCIVLLSMRPEAASGKRARVPEMVHESGKAAPAALVWPAKDTKEYKRVARERSQPWLEARGRDAAGLIAVWDLTHDEALLQEAAEKFPNEPRVCMAMIRKTSDKAPDALPWIERLIEAEPENPHGYHLKAWALAAKKDTAGALAALTRAAGSASERNNHAAERAEAVRAVALAAGMSPADAARAALQGPFDKMTDCRVGSSISNVIGKAVEEARDAGDETRQMELTGLGLTIGESMMRGTVTGDRFANGLLQKLLADLPEDTEIGAGGRSAGALRAEVEGERQYIMQAVRHQSDAVERLRAGSDDWVISYADCFITHGERTAMSSMLELPEPLEEKSAEE